MSEHRATEVATTAILLANDTGEFRLPELKERLEISDEIPSDSTLRLVLRQLEESGWLERTHPEGRIWYRGDKLAQFQNAR
ncbi:hypothetical protein [Halegenticoccus tardaugens]|uniref:hypothetical protein n=1 Tax=Halegenticoccus tardaugens TaxID=2071624 RepID=UPI00100B450A|nr:hypothetical protein [Halegenticoccus tardaugens]